MRRLLSAIGLACSLCASYADTNSFLSGPLPDAMSVLSATNLAAVTYGIFDTAHRTYGGGAGCLYNITPAVSTGVFMQWLNGGAWMPTAQFQFQLPIRLWNTVELVPFAFTAAGGFVAGKGGDNGSGAVGILGGGLGVKLYGNETHSRLDIFTAYAKWTGFPDGQVYGGLMWRF